MLVVRIVVALLLALVFGVVLLLLNIVLAGVIFGFETAGVRAGAVVWQQLFVCTAALIIVASPRDLKLKGRATAFAKALIFVGLPFLFFQYAVSPQVALHFWNIDGLLTAMFILHGIASIVAIVCACYMAAYSIPSLRDIEPVGPPPRDIRIFEGLMSAAIGVGLVNLIVYQDLIQTTANDEIPIAAIIWTLADGSFMVIVIATQLLLLFMTVAVSRKGSRIFRTILLAWFFVGIIVLVMQGGMNLKPGWLPFLLSVVIAFLQGVALHKAYSDQATRWLNGQQVSPKAS